MKKGWTVAILLCLCAVLLAGCGGQDPSGEGGTDAPDPGKESLSHFRESLDASAVCAVAYLGFSDGSYEEVVSYLEKLGALEMYPFLADVPKENFVDLRGGEIYAVVPAKAGMRFEVCHAVPDESTYALSAGERIGVFSGEDVLLLQCNESEIVSNVLIAFLAETMTVDYSPRLSGMDGSLVTADHISDFTPYEMLASYFGYEIADLSAPLFAGTWCREAEGENGDVRMVILTLTPSGGAEYACGNTDGELVEKYAGTWTPGEAQGQITLYMTGGPVVGEDADADPAETNGVTCSFFWEIDAFYLTLTHKDGDAALFGTAGAAIRFEDVVSFLDRESEYE